MLRVGEIVAGRFELAARGGAGGMSEVYRARDAHTAQWVALKVLLPGVLCHERFAAEAQALARLSHPAIARYVAHGTMPDGTAYLVMEWVEGESLRQRLRRRAMTLVEVVALGGRVADGLSEVHRHGVVHRDIKPGNLILPGGLAERVKLVDFGIAHVPTGADRTRPGAVLGTPGYVAPEQARGFGTGDARADVFALGCVLYECLTGGRAIGAADGPTRVADLGDTVPAALAGLVRRMLAENPDDRPRDGEEVARALRALKEDVPTQASPTPLRPRGALERIGYEEGFLACVLRSEGLEDTPAVRRTLGEYGANLERARGGRAVATFPGVVGLRDQAFRAARAALALRRIAPGARVALVARRVADPLPTQGEEDVLAHTHAGAVALDEVVALLLEREFDVRHDGGAHLRGEREPEDRGATLLGRTMPFLGRTAELELLASALRASREESRARAVLCVGTAGSGKSRLFGEFLRQLRAGADPYERLIGRGDAVTAGSPYALLGPALRRLAGLAQDNPLETRRERFRARLGRHVAENERERVVAFLGEVAGVPFSDESDEALRAARHNPTAMADAVADAFELWLAAECAVGPLVILLDDLQWGDWPSLALCDRALRNTQAPLLVVGFGRPELGDLFPRLWTDRALQEVRLPPLAVRACERLAREALGAEAPAEAVARIVAQSVGSPLYLEELIRAQAAGRASGDLPATVAGMIEANLLDLPGEARRVLRAGSVFGWTFPAEGVARLCGSAGADDISEWLDELLRREVIVRADASAGPDDRRYRFRHDLVREAAYAMLSEEARRLGHRLAAEWLEARGDADAAALGDHFERGGEPERAIAPFLRASEQALEASDFASALALADRGLGAGARGEAAGALLLVKAQAHSWRAEYGETVSCAAAAAERLPEGSVAWLRAADRAIPALATLGRLEEMRAWIERVKGVPPDPDTEADQVICLADGASFLTLAGCYAEADALMERVDRFGEDLSRIDPLVAQGLLKARALRALHAGDLCRYVEAQEAQWAVAGRMHAPRNAATIETNLGYAYAQLGDFGRAERTLREALATGERMGLARVVSWALHNLGPVLGAQGRLAEARAAEERAVEEARREGDKRLEGASRRYLARILLAGGDEAGAEREARRACELLVDSPPVRATAQALLGRVLLARGDVAQALGTARDAMALRDSLGSIVESESLVFTALAEALRAAGDLGAARAVALRGLVRLRERAAKIHDPDWREGFLSRVPENADLVATAVALGVDGN